MLSTAILDNTMATLIGIDYGHKKIGFAIGQTITGTANPLETIKQNGEMWRKIGLIFKQWQPIIAVVGQPLLADGKPHPLEKDIENFMIELKKRYNVKIYRENETLTSVEAREYQRSNRGLSHLDAHAAAIFLESWMGHNEY